MPGTVCIPHERSVAGDGVCLWQLLLFTVQYFSIILIYMGNLIRQGLGIHAFLSALQERHDAQKERWASAGICYAEAWCHGCFNASLHKNRRLPGSCGGRAEYIVPKQLTQQGSLAIQKNHISAGWYDVVHTCIRISIPVISVLLYHCHLVLSLKWQKFTSNGCCMPSISSVSCTARLEQVTTESGFIFKYMLIYANICLWRTGRRKILSVLKKSHCRDPHSILFTWLRVEARDQQMAISSCLRKSSVLLRGPCTHLPCAYCSLLEGQKDLENVGSLC